MKDRAADVAIVVCIVAILAIMTLLPSLGARRRAEFMKACTAELSVALCEKFAGR